MSAKEVATARTNRSGDPAAAAEGEIFNTIIKLCTLIFAGKMTPSLKLVYGEAARLGVR
jgi:hypothetical protein